MSKCFIYSVRAFVTFPVPPPVTFCGYISLANKISEKLSNKFVGRKKAVGEGGSCLPCPFLVTYLIVVFVVIARV